jgi:ankyrin repeat protein
MIEMLIDAGADPGARLTPSGETALMIATRTGNVAAVDVLVERGAEVDARDTTRGQTALMWAAAEGRVGALRALVRHGADVDARSTVRNVSTPSRSGPPMTSVVGGITPLILASRQNDAASIRELLEAGADVNLTMGDGGSALLLAILNGHYESAMTLLETGADPNLADARGRAALYAAIDMRNFETTDLPSPQVDDLDVLVLIDALIERGADTNARLSDTLPYRGGLNPTWLEEVGATPFYRAAASGDIEVMRLLLERGADPDVTASDGSTPLMAAAGVGWLPGITFEWPPEDALAALELCLELGNDVNAANADGLTALHGAAFRGWNLAVRLLVENGAELTAADGQGRIPLDWAEGVSFGGQSPRREEQTIALLEELMEKGESAELRSR